MTEITRGDIVRISELSGQPVALVVGWTSFGTWRVRRVARSGRLQRIEIVNQVTLCTPEDPDHPHHDQWVQAFAGGGS